LYPLRLELAVGRGRNFRTMFFSCFIFIFSLALELELGRECLHEVGACLMIPLELRHTHLIFHELDRACALLGRT
jgi:hypothetical protein